MAYYTLSFKDLYDNLTTAGTWEDKVQEVGNQIFTFSFPWYTEKNQSLEDFKRIFVETHFTDEIGFETLGLFKMQMQRVLFQKIPYYSQLYTALNIHYDPLVNHEVSGTKNGAESGSSANSGKNVNSGSDSTLTNGTSSDTINVKSADSGNSEVENTTSSTSDTTGNKTENNQTLTSDYPQATFTKTKDYASALNRGQLTDVTSSNVSDSSSGNSTTKNESSGTSESVGNGTSSTTTTVTHGMETATDSKNETESSFENSYSDSGWMGGSKTEELEKYRKAIRNINEMLLKEFDDLFMGLNEPLENKTWCSPLF